MSDADAPPGVRRACMFCGRNDAKITVEHVLSKPIRAELAAIGPFQTQIEYQPRFGERDTVAQYQSVTAGVTRRAFCTTCNGGWMQQMDNEIAPVIAPLIKGEPTSLATKDQQAIAAWVTKIALVYEAATGEKRSVPDSEYRRFHLERRPIPMQPIDLSHYVGRGTPHAFGLRTIDLLNERNEFAGVHGRLCTLTIGQLVVQSLLPGPDFDHRDVGLRPAGRVRIWPADVRNVQWPPTPPLTDEHALEEFAQFIPRRPAP